MKRIIIAVFAALAVLTAVGAATGTARAATTSHHTYYRTAGTLAPNTYYRT